MPGAAEGLRRGVEFLAKTVASFVALELLLLPFREGITAALQNLLYSFLPHSFQISWECTALDEVLLLSSAIWWAGGEREERIRRIGIGAAAVEAYNLMRIAVLAYYPSETLHTILFRWGGFLLIVALFYLFENKEYKQGRDN